MSLTVVDNGLLSSDSQYTGMKSRIINGGMVIDQRNAGASKTLPAATVTYTVDRFALYCPTGTGHTYQQVTDAPAGFSNSFKFIVGTGGSPATSDQNEFLQFIEGYNVADLAWGTASAKAVTFSFWVKSSLTGNFGFSIQSVNGGTSYSYTALYTISSANTWTYITISVLGCTNCATATTNGTGVYIGFSFGAGSAFQTAAGAWTSGDYKAPTSAVNLIATSGATFQVTGVQLEKGSTATSFDYRPYGTELALCQRYYYKAITGTAFNQLAFCNIRTTTSHYAFLQIPVTLRANPSSIDYGGIGIISAWGAGVTGLTSLSFANASYGTGQTQVLLDAVTTGAVGTVGQISMLLGSNSATGYVALNSEL